MNVEKHRTWIKESRVDVSMSSRYDAFEDQFIKISNGENAGELKEKLYKLNKAERDLLDSWYAVKNQGLLWDKSTMDANGKCTVHDHEGRPLIQGDGLIPQYQRFASKMKYTRLDISVIDKMMEQMVDKCENPVGNHFMFAVNKILWNQINTTLRDWLRLWNSTPTMIYSKAAGTSVKVDNPVKVGATFMSYEIAGNVVTFLVDNSLSKYYPTKGFGLCMDLTPDLSTGNPAVGAFTLKNKEFISNKLTGVGFQNGDVSTPVAGGKLIVSGYYGIAAFAPYKSFILSQN